MSYQALEKHAWPIEWTLDPKVSVSRSDIPMDFCGIDPDDLMSFFQGKYMWMFPKIVVPPNHPFLSGFQL